MGIYEKVSDDEVAMSVWGIFPLREVFLLS